MKRLFAAIKINPDENFLHLFEELKNALKHEKIKWVEPYNLHLTLRFFGETEEENIPSIIAALQTGASKHNPFNSQIEEIGIFGSSYNPKVIWAGIAAPKPFSDLKISLYNELEKIGYFEDRQNFVPHLTLGRINYLKDKDLFQDIISGFKDEYFQEISIKGFYLFESKLTKTGPIYTIVEKIKLQE
jgi:2'-5' RNA ligase